MLTREDSGGRFDEIINLTKGDNMKFKVDVEIDWIGESYQDEHGEYHSEGMSIDEAVKKELIDSVTKTVSGKISNVITNAVKDKINYSIDSLIDDTLRNFLDRQIKITDRYGTVKSTYENVEEMLCEKFDAFILQKVDSKGNAQTGCVFGDGVDGSRISHMIQQKVDTYKGQYTKQIEKEASRIAEGIKRQVDNKMKSEIQKQVADKVFATLEL